MKSRCPLAVPGLLAPLPAGQRVFRTPEVSGFVGKKPPPRWSVRDCFVVAVGGSGRALCQAGLSGLCHLLLSALASVAPPGPSAPQWERGGGTLPWGKPPRSLSRGVAHAPCCHSHPVALGGKPAWNTPAASRGSPRGREGRRASAWRLAFSVCESGEEACSELILLGGYSGTGGLRPSPWSLWLRWEGRAGPPTPARWETPCCEQQPG